MKDGGEVKRLVVKKKTSGGVVRKTLTVATPFKLRTDQRIRQDNQMDQEREQKEEYEPLWAQIKKNFKLRDDER